MTERDAAARKRALLDRIQSEGAEAAYQALLGVCRDPKAPAPAKATSGTTLLRVGGYMDPKQTAPAKPPEEMTSAEIDARLRELEAKRLGLLEPDDADGDASGIFG